MVEFAEDVATRLVQIHTSDFSTPAEFDGLHPASMARLAEQMKLDLSYR